MIEYPLFLGNARRNLCENGRVLFDLSSAYPYGEAAVAFEPVSTIRDWRCLPAS